MSRGLCVEGEKKNKRQVLVETALRLFNEHGFHGTGIDTIMRVSGVSKTTLYKYFDSKEALILAVLVYRHEQFAKIFDEYVAKSRAEDNSAEGHILAMFDALHEWFNGQSFFGCNFINASAEYGHAESPIRIYSAKHKAWIEEQIEEILGEGSREKAEKIVMLMDGAISAAHVRRDKQAAVKAKQVAEILLRQSI